MTRNTIRIGIDTMLQLELHAHGWEIAVLDRNGQTTDLFIEENIPDRDLKIRELVGDLGFRELVR